MCSFTFTLQYYFNIDFNKQRFKGRQYHKAYFDKRSEQAGAEQCQAQGSAS